MGTSKQGKGKSPLASLKNLNRCRQVRGFAARTGGAEELGCAIGSTAAYENEGRAHAYYVTKGYDDESLFRNSFPLLQRD
jgi:hypothetical protein